MECKTKANYCLCCQSDSQIVLLISYIDPWVFPFKIYFKKKIFLSRSHMMCNTEQSNEGCMKLKTFSVRQECEAVMVCGASPCDSGMFPLCHNKRERVGSTDRDV